ncbi:NurA domain protein [Novipirellula galeiformis]|uniref:NurA domain protein n=1 Tax=Novipirellula galeiformis TaxID=2528004 RepID=A0A5C6CKC4_9BACT|nr:DNA double-strand break repair nuclease NurA [Novipirellula galeiformis]TWU24862.1 NurA domain protein [Novipirellula galeiformis]
MPYEGEFARYRSLRRIADAEQVQKLLNRSRIANKHPIELLTEPCEAPLCCDPMPAYILAIDGSYQEVDVQTGYPGAKVGYVTVASVLLDLAKITELDEQRPVDPREFRKTEQADTIDAALPGSNVVTISHTNARESFRQQLFESFHDTMFDDDNHTRLLSTYESLLAHKPTSRGQECPYRESHGCDGNFIVAAGCSSTPCCGRPVYSTDALRIHERFNDVGTNGEAFGLVMQVWERILMIHLLQCFERQGILGKISRLGFFMDGPLAQFGPPAWLSRAISIELMRLNREVREETQRDLLIVGIEKSGNFVSHFEEIDTTEEPGEQRFPRRSYQLLTDSYIKRRIIFSESEKQFGADTYFGRKFFYKTACGARIVANMPFLTEEQDTIATGSIDQYPEFALICKLLDKLVSSRFENAVSPLVAAHSHAAIPLHLGTKVLKRLANALMGDR